MNGLEVKSRILFIGRILNPLRSEGIHYRLASEDGKDLSALKGIDPDFYATLTDFVSIYKITPFYKREREVARVYYWEKDMRLEIFDAGFKKNYEAKIKNDLDIYKASFL